MVAARPNPMFNSSKWWNFSDWWLIEQYNLVRETTQSISFPESHDTPRLFEELHGNIDGLKQRYLFSALFSAGAFSLDTLPQRPRDGSAPRGRRGTKKEKPARGGLFSSDAVVLSY